MSRTGEAATIDHLLSSDMRVEILKRMVARRTDVDSQPGLSIAEFAEETGEPMNCALYHFLVLLRAGAIRSVDGDSDLRCFGLDADGMPALPVALAFSKV